MRLAEILSIILGPQIWLPLILTCFLIFTGLDQSERTILFPALILLQLVLPFAFIRYMVQSGKVTAWDLPVRQERYPFLLVMLGSYLISVVLIFLYGNRLLLNISLLLFILLIVLSVVTRAWKISLHAGLNTAGALLINFLFDWRLPWLYLAIPLVIWARFSLKRHTMSQLIAGVLVSAGVVLLGLWWIGYI